MVIHKSDFDDSDRARALRRVTALGQVETISRISPTSQRVSVVKDAPGKPARAAKTQPIVPAKSASIHPPSDAPRQMPKITTSRCIPGSAEFGRPAKRPAATAAAAQAKGSASATSTQAKRQEPATTASPRAKRPAPPVSRVIRHFADDRPPAPAATSPAAPAAPSAISPTSPPATTSAAPDPEDILSTEILDAAFRATLEPTELQSSDFDDYQSIPTKLPRRLPKFSFQALTSQLAKLQDGKAKAIQAVKDGHSKAMQAVKSAHSRTSQAIKDGRGRAAQAIKDGRGRAAQAVKDSRSKIATTPKPTKKSKPAPAAPELSPAAAAPEPKPAKTAPKPKVTEVVSRKPKPAAPKATRSRRRPSIADLDVDTTATVAQRVVLAIIGILVLIVSGGVIALLNYNTKAQLESKINHLATTYYEEYFYPNVFSGNISISDVLAEFGETGLTEVNLRTLILTNPELTSSEIHFLRQHCDQERTTVRYYPLDPYDRTSYRTEFDYSCNFEDDLVSV